MRTAFERLLAALTPQDCFLCGQACGRALICPACDASLPVQTPGGCPVCASPDTGGQVCGACLHKPPAFDATRALYHYAFPVDRLVQALKYRSRFSVACHLGAMLANTALAVKPDRVVPMPLHPRRLRERGFNQAYELARALAARHCLKLGVEEVYRVRDTAPQADLPLSDRKANMRAAFCCDVRLDGLNILVIDDVMTTGASLASLASTLKRQGAARVDNLVVARTPPPI